MNLVTSMDMPQQAPLHSMQTCPGTWIRVTKAESQSRSRWALCTFRKVWTTVALTSGDEIYHHLTASSALGITYTSSLLTHQTKGVDKNDPKFHKSDKFTFILKIKFIISEFSWLHTVVYLSNKSWGIFERMLICGEHTHTQSWLLNNAGASAHQHSVVWDLRLTRSQPPVYTAPPSVALRPRVQTAMGPVLVLTIEKAHAYMNLPSSDHVVQGQPCVCVHAHSISLLL